MAGQSEILYTNPKPESLVLVYYIVVPHVAVSNCRCNMVEFSETWDGGRAEMKDVLRLHLCVCECMCVCVCVYIYIYIVK